MQSNAILLLNKEANISSNKAVNIVKNLLGASKAGHLGTLDVLGRGLLPITINKATKLFDLFLEKDKEYITIFKFGQTSPTLDLEGPLSSEDPNVNISKKEILNILNKFKGPQLQLPPQYSAKKINGQKAYSLSRRGETVLLKPKQINIYNIELLEKIEKNVFKFKINCSSGTYIRSICRDMAKEFSTSGIMLDILRTKCGDFKIEDSFSIKEIQEGNYSLIDPEKLFDLPKINLSNTQFDLLKNGAKIDIPLGKYKLFYGGNFLGIGENISEKFRMSLKLF